MTTQLLIDNSAWANMNSPALPAARRAEIAANLVSGDIVVCLPFLLEAGYSARHARGHEQICRRLLALPWAPIDPMVESRAHEAQGQLARSGHHRIPPVDIMIGALADRHGLGILHYDHDYDHLTEKTDLRFESVWLAERGSL